MAATSSTGGRGTSRDQPSVAAGRRPGSNYTSLNLQSYKGARPDGKAKGTHGLQSLGKVVATSRRMPNPASLPSLRSENAGNDPSVALVPSGGGGWKKDGKEVKEGGENPSPPLRPAPKQEPPPRDEGVKEETQRVVHAPPPPPLQQQPPPPPLRHPTHPAPIPGKRFKADFPSLEEQETMSKKEVEELHRRRGKDGSPEPGTGKRTGLKGAWEHEPAHSVPSHEPVLGSYHEPTHGVPSHKAVPSNMGPYSHYLPPRGPGPYPPPPNPYMMHPRHPGTGMPPFHGGPHNPSVPGRGHFPPPHVKYHNPFPYPADPYKMPEGYHDELTRPPTVKMDDIKSMDVEEEEGGWAGHHEEVDYSKEVVFSDSSDEDSSGRQSKNGKTKDKSASLGTRQQRKVKGSRSRQSLPDEEAEKGAPQAARPLESPVEKQDRHGHHKDRSDNDPPVHKRHEGGYHPYQRPGPYPAAVSQYPPSYPPQGPYPMYPPPYGPRHHYPPQQHMGGNRYPPHRMGGQAAHKRNFPEREEHAWGENRSGGKKKWEDKEKPIILAKGEKKALEVENANHAKEKSEMPQKQSGDQSEPPDTPPEPEKNKVTFVGVEEGEVGSGEVAEEQVQPTRRGNQPKIMLRKLGEKDVDGFGGRMEGKDRQGDGKKFRQTEMRVGGEGEEGGADATSKTKMAWNVTDRGPIISPKTLYEPEGKKSADKFKKYHAQMQEPQRGGKPEQDEAVGEDASDTMKSPVEKLEGGIKQVKTDSESQKLRHDSVREKLDGVQIQGRDSPDVASKQGAEFSRQHSNDKPQHRKDDSRRPKGGLERRQSQGGARSSEMAPRARGDGEKSDGRFEERGQKPQNSGDRKQDMHRTEGNRQDNREPRNKGRRHDPPEARRHDGPEVKRHDGPEARRHNGPEARRHGGAEARRHDGPEPRRHDGPEAKRHDGHVTRRQDGPETRRHDSSEARRHDGPEARRHDGSEVRRHDSFETRRHGGSEARSPESKVGDRRPEARGGDRRHNVPESRQENVERKGKEESYRDSQDSRNWVGNKQSERRASDQKGRRRETPSSNPHSSGRDHDQSEARKGDKKPRRETGRGLADTTNKVSERSVVKKGSEEESAAAVSVSSDVRLEEQEHTRNRGPAWARGQPKRGAPRREDRKQERSNRGGHDRGQRAERASTKMPSQDTKTVSSQEGRDSEVHTSQREKGQPELGYDELVDISDLAFDECMAADPGEVPDNAEGKAEEGTHPLRAENRVQSATGAVGAVSGEENRPRGGTRPLGNNRKSTNRKDDRRKGNRRIEEDEEPPRRMGAGRGRGRDKRRPGIQEKPTREEQKKSDKSQPIVEEGPSTEDSASGLEASSSQQKLDVAKLYDLNSHMVAVVDDIAGQNPEEGLLSPTAQAEFVEVTSKKAQKEKVRKEKEEQRREEKRIEEQKKKKSPANKGQSEKSSLSTNKPYSAWSATEEKDSGEVWNAAPGSQLKMVPGSIAPAATVPMPWVPTSLPTGTFGLGKGGVPPGEVAKAAVPHTAELVTSTDADVYSLFGRPGHYLPFSPSSVPTMLDAAVDSTIGTVTSPRTVTSHTPLLMDPSLSLEVLDAGLADVQSLPAEVKSDPQTRSGSRTLPPRLKSGGRGRGGGQKGGGERRDKRRGRPDRDHVGRQDRQLQSGIAEETSYPLSGVPPGRKGEVKKLYVHPRARSDNPAPSNKDSKGEVSKTKSAVRGEAKNEEPATKVAMGQQLSLKKQQALSKSPSVYEVTLATQQSPRAGRESVSEERGPSAQGSTTSSQTEGSKAGSSVRPESTDVRCRPSATVVSKTFSYAEVLKTTYPPRENSASSSKHSSPCLTPSESPHQSRVAMHSGRTTPSNGSTAGSVPLASCSPVSGGKLVSPVCTRRAKSERVGLDEDEHDEEEESLLSDDVSLTSQQGRGQGSPQPGVGQGSPLTSQPTGSPVPPLPHRGHAPQPNRGHASPLSLQQGANTEVGTKEVPQIGGEAVVPASVPTATEEGINPTVATPPPDTKPSAVDKASATSDASDPALIKPAKVTPPLTAPSLMTPDTTSQGVGLHVPPGLSVPPAPLHIPNLTDHQKLLTQQQLLAAAQRQYRLSAHPPTRLPMPLPQPIMSSLLPPALIEQQRGLLEQQSRVLQAQDMVPYPHHLTHHPPSISTQLTPSGPGPQFSGKQGVLQSPPQHLSGGPRALLGNQPSMTPQGLELQKLLLHLLQQQQVQAQQVQAQAQAQAHAQAHAQAQAIHKQNYLLQQREALQMTKIQMEKMEAQSGPSGERKAHQPAPLHQQPLLSRPLSGANKEMLAMNPYMLPTPGLSGGRQPAMFSRPSSYMQLSGETPPPLHVTAMTGKAMEVSSVAEQQQTESPKPSSLSITATPFIPKASNPDVEKEPPAVRTDVPTAAVERASLNAPPHPTLTAPSQALGAGSYWVPPPPPSSMPQQLPTAAAGGGRGGGANQIHVRQEGQAYQVISPQVEHGFHHGATLLPGQERRGVGKEAVRSKDTPYRFPAHHPLPTDPTLLTAMTTGLDMQSRLLQAQKPFPVYGVPAGVSGRSKLPEPITAARSAHVHEALKAMQQNAIGNKRPLLPTPPPPTHANILPPRIPPTQSWPAPAPRGPLNSHGAQQAVLYPDQRNPAGYSTGTGHTLLGGAAYHRNQI